MHRHKQIAVDSLVNEMNKNTSKDRIWKREILKIGKLSLPLWALILIFSTSIVGATSVVVYYATVSVVTQTSTVTTPISVTAYSVNGINGANSIELGTSFVVPAGSEFIFSVNTINNANRPVNTTMVNLVNAQATNGMPTNIYYLPMFLMLFIHYVQYPLL